MPVEMKIWKITDSGAEAIVESKIDYEKSLEDILAKDPSLVTHGLLVIGRQVEITPHPGYLDLLCMDADGTVHVLELKRDKTSRDVVAQVLDYGSWAANLSLDDLDAISRNYSDCSLSERFFEHFGSSLPEAVNLEQQFTIVASELDPTSERLVEFLSSSYGVPINAVFFKYFEDSNSQFLARTWLIDPVESKTTSSRAKKKHRPWNGTDFYVIQGTTKDSEGRWDIAKTWNFLSAGGGSWYSKPLKNLFVGCWVFAYVGGAGYVGVGRVTGEMMRAGDALVDIDGKQLHLINQPGISTTFREQAKVEDPDLTEYVVPVEWISCVDSKDAVKIPGLFTSQVTVCRLTDELTIHEVENAFPGLIDARSQS